MDLIGRRIQDYRIEALLGEGGMGSVFRAQDVNLLRPVALKVMHSHLARQEEFKRRFLIEAQSAARLEHPGITRIYGFGHENDLLFMVLEFIPGGSLGRYLRSLQQQQKIVQLQEMLHLLAQVADALDFAHRHNVIHRDLKPDNILLKQQAEAGRPGEPALRALITDFGLAKLLDEAEALTATGTLMGTLAYMSPEQVLNRPLDGRSDLYSLGVILYQLATGRLPISITNPSDAVLKHLAGTPPPSPSSVKPELSARLSRLIEKSVALVPDERFQSGAAFAAVLREEAVRLTRRDVTRFAPPETVLEFFTELDAAPQVIPDSAPAVEPPEAAKVGAANLAAAEISGPFITVSREGISTSRYSLDKSPLTVGRDPASDVLLEGQGVSRKHARLERTGKGWYVVDLGSTNGTFLNGNRLQPDVPVAWPAQTRLRIGDNWLTLEGVPAAGPTDEPSGRPDVSDPVAGAKGSRTIRLDDEAAAAVAPAKAAPIFDSWPPAWQESEPAPAAAAPVAAPKPAPVAQEKPARPLGMARMPGPALAELDDPLAKAAKPLPADWRESKSGAGRPQASWLLGIMVLLACCSTVPLPALIAGVSAGGTALITILLCLGFILSILAAIWLGQRGGGRRRLFITLSSVILLLNICLWTGLTFVALSNGF